MADGAADAFRDSLALAATTAAEDRETIAALRVRCERLERLGRRQFNLACERDKRIAELEEMLRDRNEYREAFNHAIIKFDAGYAGWNYLESAIDVVKRAEAAESALAEAQSLKIRRTVATPPTLDATRETDCG